jgi:hypothetical protein
VDDRIRRLERQCHASGDPSDEARFLVAALQAESVARWPALERLAVIDAPSARETFERWRLRGEDVRLLALLGFSPAEGGLDGERPVSSVRQLAIALGNHGVEGSVRAGVAIARAATAARMLESERAQANRALDALITWADTQAASSVDVALEIAQALDSGRCIQGRPEEQFGPETWAHFSLSQLAYFIGRRTGRLHLFLSDEPETHFEAGIRAGVDALAASPAAELHGVPRLIVGALGPWIVATPRAEQGA